MSRLAAVERQHASAKARRAVSACAGLVERLNAAVAVAKGRHPTSSENSLYSLDVEFARELDRILALT